MTKTTLKIITLSAGMLLTSLAWGSANAPTSKTTAQAKAKATQKKSTYQNQANAYDVNGDGCYTKRDATLLKTKLIYMGNRSFAHKNVKDDFFPDVNGDSKFDKADVAALTATKPGATACKAHAKR